MTNFNHSFNVLINRYQQGATLIEVLVAVSIFSVGVMGVTALQLTSFVQADDTKQRSVALWKAQELVDRMRATKGIYDIDGQIPLFIAEIGNDKSGIGVFDEDEIYACPDQPPARCDIANADCTVEESVAFDVWGVMCDPNSGIAVATTGRREIAGLQNLEIALVQVVNGGETEYRLYFEWLSRSATRNTGSNSGINNGLSSDDGTVRNVTANLCGDDEDIDSRLEAYCVRFE